MPSADAYWIALREVRGVGPRVYRLLLEKFVAPDKVFAASVAEMAAIGVARSENIVNFHDFDPAAKELCELPRIGAHLVRWSDPEYPPSFRQIADPPPYLFVPGDAPLTTLNCIAIVGARAASDAGRRMAQRLGMELAAKDFAVVRADWQAESTGEAHRGALDAGGRTIAVMGCGIDVIYPAVHRTLAAEIVEKGGAVISELPVRTQPLAENFPSQPDLVRALPGCRNCRRAARSSRRGWRWSRIARCSPSQEAR
jgi:DNA processing protein